MGDNSAEVYKSEGIPKLLQLVRTYIHNNDYQMVSEICGTAIKLSPFYILAKELNPSLLGELLEYFIISNIQLKKEFNAFRTLNDLKHLFISKASEENCLIFLESYLLILIQLNNKNEEIDNVLELINAKIEKFSISDLCLFYLFNSFCLKKINE